MAAEDGIAAGGEMRNTAAFACHDSALVRFLILRKGLDTFFADSMVTRKTVTVR